jgi:hypothetical protein
MRQTDFHLKSVISDKDGRLSWRYNNCRYLYIPLEGMYHIKQNNYGREPQ